MGKEEKPTLDNVYADRNLLAQLAATLAQLAGLQAGIAIDPQELLWPIIYIDLPTGQTSWHVPQDDLVAPLEVYERTWDGHSVEEKNDRIRRFLTEASQRHANQE